MSITEQHAVLIYNYVCPTCGLEVGPYSYDHKIIECGNGCGNLLRAVLQKAYLADAGPELEPKVIKQGKWGVKK